MDRPVPSVASRRAGQLRGHRRGARWPATAWRRVAAIVALTASVAVGLPAAASAAHDTVHQYQVEVDGPVGSDVEAFERRVAEILADPRGWSLGGTVRFEQVDEAVTTIVLARPDAVDAADEGCSAEYSCRVGDRVLINERNWREMTPAWRAAGGDLRTYREYLINHEVGHLLGFDHHDCPERGADAPVMQQQSMGLDGCVPAGWPDEAERRAFAELADLPPEVAEAEQVDNDGVPDGLDDAAARELRDQLVAQRVLAVRTRQVAEPVVELVETGWSVLLGRRGPSGPWAAQAPAAIAPVDAAWGTSASTGLHGPAAGG